MLTGHLRRFEIPGVGAAGTDAAGAGTAAASAVAGMQGGVGGAPDEAAAELSSWSVGSEPAEARPFSSCHLVHSPIQVSSRTFVPTGTC